MARLGDYISLKTGKLDVNASSEDGQYPFFTCAKKIYRIDNWSYNCECVLIAGNGDLNVKYYQGKFDAYQRTYILESKDKEILDVRYLFHFMSKYIETLRENSIGGVIKYIKKGDIEEAEIPLEDITEQRRIAAILDKADEIKITSEQANSLRDAFIDSAYNEISDGSDNIRMTIQQLLDEGFITLHKDGNHGSDYPRKSEFREDGVPFLSANCFDDSGNLIPTNVKFLDPQKAMNLKHGRILRNDVLLAHNATVGRVALYDGKLDSAMIGTSLTCFRCDSAKLNPHFLFTAFRSLEFQKQLEKTMGQSTRNQVPITAQRKLSINVPPIHVQNSVAILVDNASNSFDSIASQVDLAILLNYSSSQQILS